MHRFVRTFVFAALVVALFPATAIAEEAPASNVDIVILGGTAVVPTAVEAHLNSCTNGTVTRVAGPNRYSTAAKIAISAFPGGATTAYLANGTTYPDAVAAGPVAALNGAPLLLTKASTLPGETAQVLRDLNVTEVIVLGGERAISSGVASQLGADYTVTRIAGDTRDATAALISASAFPGPVDVAYVATGTNFPDALVGGPAAYADDGPILLTDPNQLSPATEAEIGRLQPGRIVILGGTAAVAASVESSLSNYAPVSRLAGRDRYATAAAIAQTLPKPTSKIYVTTGLKFPDAVAGTPLALDSPMLLASAAGLPPATAAAISSFTGVPCTPIVKVSQFTTYYTAGQPRVTNIHTIANATNGATVLAGETFSLNAHVGQRTVAKGYVAAPAIINGEVYCCDSPINIGGGTSQFATTLYNAVFFGGYEDVYHRPHSIWFSKYPMGREATLGWEGPDVKFHNDTSSPLTIKTLHTSTSVTVEFWGWNDGRRVTAGLSGNATTRDGGVVRVDRTITYADGTRKTQSWWHRYNPLHPDAL
ncbi:MAG: cell wall-binding repeat-containing protein [Actinomycetota bacterium]|nr:cell wall-binding repeat-containing protein [Actinomycetota bacterium]